jgi:hypothetical protein
MVGNVLSTARADGKHPHYVRALGDLRSAHAWLRGAPAGTPASDHEKQAVFHIQETINNINVAARDDDQNIKDNPVPDVDVKHKARIQKALDLLYSAYKDLKFEEDDKKASGWRQRAFKNLDAAIKNTRMAMDDTRKEK